MEADAFSEEDIELLKGFAEVLSEGYTRVEDLERIEESEKASRRRAALDRVRVSAYEMRESTDIQKVLASLYGALKDIGVEFDDCSVQIVDGEGERFECYELGPDRVHLIVERPLMDSAVYEAWRDKRPIYRRDLDEEDKYNERSLIIREASGKSIRSVVDVPFSHGTIAINSVRPNAFSEKDIETLQQFAEVLSEAYTRFEDIQRIEESEEKYRSVVEHSQDVIFRLDPDGNYILISPVVKEITGYSPEEFYADRTTGRRLVLPEDFEKMEEGFRKASSGEVSRDVEYRVRTKDGKILWVSQTVFPIPDSEGRIVAIEGTIRDITERKQAEEALESYAAEVEQANEEVKRFAYIVSHDLRAPLVNLKGFAAELRSALEVIGPTMNAALPHLDEKQRQAVVTALQEDIPESLGFIDSSVTRMDDFINAVLKLSRLGRRELELKLIDMDALVQTTLKALAHQIAERQVKVTVRRLPEVVADRTSMEQIMGNILTNAVLYIAPGRPGEIEITAERGRDETTFHIRDNGRGIAEEDMDKVFAPFRRAGRQDVPGEGMGLPYVQALVRRHGGRIWCESELGAGTTFTFTISNYLAERGNHV